MCVIYFLNLQPLSAEYLLLLWERACCTSPSFGCLSYFLFVSPLSNPAVVHWPGIYVVNLYTVSCEWTASICTSSLLCLVLWALPCRPTHCFHHVSHIACWTAVQLPQLVLCLSVGMMLNILGAWPSWKAVNCQVWLCFSAAASVYNTFRNVLIVSRSSGFGVIRSALFKYNNFSEDIWPVKRSNWFILTAQKKKK